MSEQPTASAAEDEKSERNWRPLNAIQRRILGVLVEKAKTTPDAYPMSLNGITTACNQKSNRDPVMNLDSEQIVSALEQLREMGSVAEVQSSGRVPKYRHYAFDWLGVDKLEMAVMAELLLRGPQTVGELRGRASRMEPINSLNDLKPILDSLIAKGLVISLTPEGRGQVVTHGLFTPQELERQRAEASNRAAAADEPSAPAASAMSPQVRASVQADALAELRVEVAQLRAMVVQLRDEVSQLRELAPQLARPSMDEPD